uniref:Ci-male-specific lethal 3-like protein n=1 Tax=Ciona intestinalis TaxID=7719 RepID=Q4H384_CIOIN|nr:uncharacterized protein LOC778671 [Ciona intestinalis]BAE06543.1 Ci-male-specific lethal 3-like [Ciona intestinalis]|eukprot:NP_001071757.1 uncharacterized protein LOC778671 [Ciona intestinalis]
MKPNFVVGERVLCYEPDKSKAKVLYDAKVLDADYIKDGKSKKEPEYKIHFQGWNSAWDRWANESYVLKNTEENRKLQRKLARQALRQLKGRKKVHLPGVANILKSAPEKEVSSDSDSSLCSDRTFPIKEEIIDSEYGSASPHPKRRRKSATSTSKQSDDAMSIETPSVQSNDPQPPISTVTRKAFHIEIPASLQIRLEHDNKMITKENMLVGLPAKLNVVQILENYIKYFAITHARLPSSEKQTSGDIPPEKNLNLCKETCEDLRILFDFSLPLILLYFSEQSQCIQMVENGILVDDQHPNLRSDYQKSEENVEKLDNSEISGNPETIEPIKTPSTSEPEAGFVKMVPAKPSTVDVSKQLIKYTKISGHRKTAEEQIIEETHTYLIPDQPKLDRTGLSSDAQGRRRSSRLSHHLHSPNTSDEMISPPISPQPATDKRRRTVVPLPHQIPIPMKMIVFLRSPASHQHGRSDVPPSFPKLFKEGGKYSCSSPDINLRELCREAFIASAGNDVKKALHLSQVWRFSLFASDYQPEDGSNVPCSLIYGIQHFLRVFVKLPEIFARMDIRDHKLKIIAKHIQLLLRFVADHEKEIYNLSSSYTANDEAKRL